MVACVLWMGVTKRTLQRPYSPEWVRRLRGMVERHLKMPHRFVCLSNVDVEGVECIPLTDGLPGWWSKIELFKHDLGTRALYLDLDVLVTGDLSEIAAYDAPIAFTPPHSALMGTPLRLAPGVNECYQTSCMVWTPPYGRVIYEQFRHDVIRRLRGDQDWIAEVYAHWPKMPVAWFRKLRQCKEGPPDGVKVVLSMPWKNDDAARRFSWVKECWVDGDLFRAQGGMAHPRHRGAEGR
jgi:hypothetical protein